MHNTHTHTFLVRNVIFREKLLSCKFRKVTSDNRCTLFSHPLHVNSLTTETNKHRTTSDFSYWDKSVEMFLAIAEEHFIN